MFLILIPNLVNLNSIYQFEKYFFIPTESQKGD